MKSPRFRLSAIVLALLLLSVSEGRHPAMANDETGGSISADRVRAAVKSLDQLASSTLEKTAVPGIAIAVIHNDQVVHLQFYGVREAGRPERLDESTVFQVASVSKPVTSSVLAALVGDGTIGWDDHVADLDPEFRLYDRFVTREVTIRDFLCHRSGLPDHAGDLLEDLGFERAEVLRRLRYLPFASTFRSQYAYTNFGYSEAAFAASRARGESWENLAKKRVFAPLGMNSTSYSFADYAGAENRARLHVLVDGKWIPKNTRQPDAQAPAGGLSTTLPDLALWLRLQLNDGKFNGQQLVSAAALAETRTPQIVTNFAPEQGRIVTYGFGWIVSVERGGRTFCKHSGSFSLGMRSEVALLPSENLAIAVLSNAGPTGVPEGLTESFFDLVLDGKLNRDWIEFANRMFDEEIKRELGNETDYSHPPTEPSPALPAAAYVGKYANDFFGQIEIAEQGDKLVLRAGPAPLEFELKHYDRDLFTYQPTGENAGGLSGVLFAISQDGKADQVLIENLNPYGQGTFSRVK